RRRDRADAHPGLWDGVEHDLYADGERVDLKLLRVQPQIVQRVQEREPRRVCPDGAIICLHACGHEIASERGDGVPQGRGVVERGENLKRDRDHLIQHREIRCADLREQEVVWGRYARGQRVCEALLLIEQRLLVCLEVRAHPGRRLRDEVLYQEQVALI